jgi:hypothetical protein
LGHFISFESFEGLDKVDRLGRLEARASAALNRFTRIFVLGCRDSFFRNIESLAMTKMAARPLKCRLGFHGKIAWDKEPIKDIARETQYGREYKEYRIGTCIECGERVLSETMRSANGIVEAMSKPEVKLRVEARRGREEVTEKHLLETALADQERKDLLAAMTKASNDHPHLRVGELLFVALTRRIKVSLDHGVDNDSRVGHSLFYIFDSELKKAVEGIPKAEEYEVR